MPPVFASNTGPNVYAGNPETIHASGLNNEALQLEMAGNFVGAEAKYLEALRLKYGCYITSLPLPFTPKNFSWIRNDSC
jgi:hypothetical protein